MRSTNSVGGSDSCAKKLAAALKNLPFTSALSCGPSTTASLTNTNCPAGIGTLSQGVPRPTDPTAYATNNGVIDLTRIPPSVLTAVALDYKSSFTQQFNVLLEKQLGASVITVGYVGMRGSRAVMNLPDINRAAPCGGSTPNARPFAAFPRLGTINYLTPSGSSEYNALQVSFNRRLSNGLSFTSGYTYASAHDNVTGLGTGTGGYGNFVGSLPQALDNARKYDWARSDFNIQSRFTFGGNYDLPFGKNFSGPAKYALAGWSMNGSLALQTGLPFTVATQGNFSGITGLGGNLERPNLVNNNIRVSNPSVGVNGQFLDPNAFGCAPTSAASVACTPNLTTGVLGTAPRNVGYGPNQSVINLSAFKTFSFAERYHLQFRTEAFNLPNHPVFDRPAFNNLGNVNFGKITSLAPGYAMRQIQFALKVQF